MTQRRGRPLNRSLDGTPSPAAIRAGRIEAGLSQVQAAALIDAGVRSWQRWETGSIGMPAALWQQWRNAVARHPAPVISRRRGRPAISSDPATPSAASVRHARSLVGLTQDDAAALAGVSRRTWQRWEEGRNGMPANTWKRWVAALP